MQRSLGIITAEQTTWRRLLLLWWRAMYSSCKWRRTWNIASSLSRRHYGIYTHRTWK